MDAETILRDLWNSYAVTADEIHTSIDGLQAMRPEMTDEILVLDYDIVRGRDFVTISADGIRRGVEV